ncbi:hypothetical protein Daus18300_011246 [Diaporthe australafricana]|uniref:Uncharacterized protein n=1 Tax=Diaporthe australafricana TaxID=127596 RepID=A0ABR3W767_9PEZI
MANGTFFASWQLWQQMTFVLAMGILVVFCIGLAKLWWTNRHMKRIEELDAEKQVRSAQMRRSGLFLSANNNNNRRSRLGAEIPFGVKAIETGVEVEGVWVARMASMATRPPDRKWSSKRKVKTAVLDVDEAGSSRRSGRGSIRVGRISRKDILQPSAQTGRKLESLQLREGELWSSEYAENQRLPAKHLDSEQVRNLALEDRTDLSAPKGALGRIQRGIKKMTSTEAWNEQQRKHQIGTQEAREFRINAQARKPQRFYPEATTPLAPAAPVPSRRPIPQRKSSLVSETGRSTADAENTGPRNAVMAQPPATAPRSHEPRRQTSHASSVSSVDSLVTSIEELKEFAPRSKPPPLEHHPVFSSGGDREASGEEGTFGRSRSRRPPQNHARHSSSGDRSTIHDQQDAAQSAPSTALRYPPNSSRSAAYIQPRPHSLVQDQQQQQQQQQNQGVSSAAQPSPTFGPSDSYINTSTRKVNSNFEVLPAGTFGLPEQHAAEETASTAASARSSFESQQSRGRRKLQKKRTSSHYSK